MNSMTRALGACLLIAVAGGTISAQEGMPVAPDQPEAASQRNPRAIEIIEASQAALGDAKTLVCRVEKTMERTDELAPENAIFASISIGAKGSIRAIKDGEGRWLYRIDGTADDIGRKDAFEIVVLREPATVTWLDQESSTLVKASRNLARGRELSSEPEFGTAYLFGLNNKKPFQDLTRAPTLEVLEPEVIDEVLCDVVRVGYGKPNDSGDKILYIGTVDGLPRYVRDVLVTGFENRYRFSFADNAPEPTVDNIAIEQPAGWSVAYRPESLRPGYTPAGDTPAAPTATLKPASIGEGTVGYEVGSRAPAFSGQTILGTDISSDVMKDTTTLLVFWASWLPGASDLVDFLRETHASRDDVEIITFAVRERSPDAAFNMLAEAGLDDVPMMIDARDATLAYSVTRAPLVLVVDDTGVIRYRSEVSDVAETAEGVKATLDQIKGE